MKRLMMATIAELAVCGVAMQANAYGYDNDHGRTSAGTTPLMISICNPVQLPSDDYDVAGLRLSLIYGLCNDFAGIDVGLLNGTDGKFSGIALGGMNLTRGRLYGLQVGLFNASLSDQTTPGSCSIGVQKGFVNLSGSFHGWQDGLLNASVGSFEGVQTSFFNGVDKMYGAQFGIVNHANELHGVQLGIIYGIFCGNIAGSVTGCQIGLINYATRVDKGVQVGIINIIADNGWAPILPVVNGHF